MRGYAALALISSVIGCSGSNFDVVNATDTDVTASETSGEETAMPDTTVDETTTPVDTGAPDTTLADSTMVMDSAMPDTTMPDTTMPDTTMLDTAPIDTGPPCDSILSSTKDVYVDSAAKVGGKGSLGCPFSSLAEAASAPFSSTVDRIVHVKTGTYAETALIAIRTRETYRAEGGLAKLISANTTKCVTNTCAVLMNGSAVIDGFSIEGTVTAHGIVTTGPDGAPTITNTTVKGATRDGIVVLGSATLGPNAHADGNGWCGVAMRGGGKLTITGASNTFNDNKGTGMFISSETQWGAGIFMASGQLLMEGSATANGNLHGLEFSRELMAPNSLHQQVSQLTAQSNRWGGMIVNKNWVNVTLRNSSLTKNEIVGLELHYPATKFDLGDTLNPGGNTFGGATSNNKRVGIILCDSGVTASQKAEGNKWSVCPPTQQSMGSCPSLPGSYSDVAYAPDPATPTATRVDPIYAGTASGCSVGP
jgi:hypothetical protein